MSTGQRLVLRLVSSLVGLTLIATFALVVGQVVAGLTGDSDFLVPTSEWYAAVRTTRWDDQSVQLVAIGAIIVGLLLIVVSITAKPRLITLRQPKDTVDVHITPRVVAQMLRRQAEAIPGVASASAEISPAVARITAQAPMANPRRIEKALETSLTHGLKQIPWVTLPSLQLEIASARPTIDAPPPMDRRPSSSGPPTAGPDWTTGDVPTRGAAR